MERGRLPIPFGVRGARHFALLEAIPNMCPRSVRVVGLAVPLLLAWACGRGDQHGVVDRVRTPFQIVADSAIATLPTRAVCHPAGALLEDGQTPLIAEWKGCVADTSDGRFFYYRDADDSVAVIAREMRVDPRRMVALTDSLRRALSAVYGGSVRCTTHGRQLPNDVVHYRWEGAGFGVEVVAEVRDREMVSPSATVTVEYRRGETLCRGWVPAPIVAL